MAWIRISEPNEQVINSNAVTRISAEMVQPSPELWEVKIFLVDGSFVVPMSAALPRVDTLALFEEFTELTGFSSVS